MQAEILPENNVVMDIRRSRFLQSGGVRTPQSGVSRSKINSDVFADELLLSHNTVGTPQRSHTHTHTYELKN